MKYLKPLILVILVLIADQALKLWVFNHMVLGYSGERHIIGDWFRFHFTLNNGIAFGLMDGNGSYNPIIKVSLTIFRLIAAALIMIIIRSVIKKGLPTGFILGLSLILAGALGNIIDSIFYDTFLNTNFLNDDPIHGIEVRKLFQGSVIDMLYFPIIDTNYPDWFPFVGGNRIQFFRPVFNLADSAITIGVSIILLFYRKSLRKL